MSVFAILVVCTGNQCRSPVAEHDLRRRLAGAPFDFEVMSAGTEAAAGVPLHPRTAQALTAAGLDVPEHVSSPLVAEAIEVADLILTMETGQRTRVGSLAPQAAARTFTLLEFVHLGLEVTATATATAPAPDPWAVVESAAAARPVPSGTRMDIRDPISGDVELHASVLAQVIRATGATARRLTSTGSRVT